jgi:hypothetical protein
MKDDATYVHVRTLMQDFAELTGLTPPGARPRRYLWTDAFAVCNYLELFCHTGDATYRDLALRLVDQVHHALGRHRDDDPRCGWISGLSDEEGELHPTRGGLRIGKPLPERRPDEPPDDRLEWDQDGQYYHYLTKWMHALTRVSRATGNPIYIRWATELAKTAHARFTYLLHTGGPKRMYWKMSIDLTHPLVRSMGQHDPLDGFVTYSELQAAASDIGEPLRLDHEIAEMAGICRGMRLTTDDPLGIGGLLFDAARIAQLMIHDGRHYSHLLETVLNSAVVGLDAFSGGNSLKLPAKYRLAFRELGLAIGLSGAARVSEWIGEDPDLFGRTRSLQRDVEALAKYMPLKDTIEGFWTDGRNQEAETWTGHREINMVMLATSLAPDSFLRI